MSDDAAYDALTTHMTQTGENHPRVQAAIEAMQAVEKMHPRATLDALAYAAIAAADSTAPPPADVARIKAEAERKALLEAADSYGPGQLTFMGSAKDYTKAWLRTRAAAVTGGEQDTKQ